MTDQPQSRVLAVFFPQPLPLMRGQVVPLADNRWALIQGDPSGAQAYVSVQPDGSVQTRPIGGPIGPWETATPFGHNLLCYAEADPDKPVYLFVQPLVEGSDLSGEVPTPGPVKPTTEPWEACYPGAEAGSPLVQCVIDSVHPEHTVEGAFEVVKRVAWLLRGQGCGLLLKPGGENIVSWKGRSFSASRVCFPDGHIYKILTDVPGTNGAGWTDNDFVDRSLYAPALDPRD